MDQISLLPGSYIYTQLDHVLAISSKTLSVPHEKLPLHPDFYLLSASQEMSLGIEKIRDIGYQLRMKPVIAEVKIVVIDDFHYATAEAQQAFLKTFEEPPEYAYIFLVTPYLDRLLKTILSRAQVMEQPRVSPPLAKTGLLNQLLPMHPGQRLLWLDDEVKPLKDKAAAKQRLSELMDALLGESISALKEGRITLQAVEYLKEAQWKVQQGFPVPKILLEKFLLLLP